MAVTLRYFTEFGKPVFQHNNHVDLWRSSCRNLLYFIVRVRRRYESSHSLTSLDEFLVVLGCHLPEWGFTSVADKQ